MATQSERCSKHREFSHAPHGNIFEEMLRAEELMGPDYFVFYHSYRSHPVLYEVYSVLASIAYDIEIHTPLPRILKEGFQR